MSTPKYIRFRGSIYQRETPRVATEKFSLSPKQITDTTAMTLDIIIQNLLKWKTKFESGEVEEKDFDSLVALFREAVGPIKRNQAVYVSLNSST